MWARRYAVKPHPGAEQQEVQLNWKIWIRKVHRAVAMLFTLTVAANFVAIAALGMAPPWITYSPLLPLFLLMLTGLYMFALPYFPRRQQS